VLVISSATASAATECKLVQIAELPVTMLGHEPLISVSINGHPVQMLMDTGATKSLIWRASAKELDLSIGATDTRFYGVDGKDSGGITRIRDFGLAGAMAHNVNMYVGGRGHAPAGSVGLLGEDIISNWDLDVDFSAGKVRLFSPKNCKDGQVVYWAKSYSALPLIGAPRESDYLWAHVQINGHQVTAMFDTGAGVTTVTTRALELTGVKAETEIVAAGASRGMAAEPMKTSSAIFSTLSVAQETVQNVKLNIADLFSRNLETSTGSAIPQSVMDTPGMLIGADFFQAHHVYIARSQGKIYFTYNGGPIFQHLSPTESAAPDANESDSTEKH
jgi:predicted aspartyl protease